MELVAQADDNGRVFECEASNGLGVAINSAVSLSVLRQYFIGVFYLSTIFPLPNNMVMTFIINTNIFITSFRM